MYIICMCVYVCVCIYMYTITMFYTKKWSIFYRINKLDVRIIRDSRPPNVNFWAQRAPRKINICYAAAISHSQGEPCWACGDVKKTRKKLLIAEMHLKGMISVSLRSCIFFPTHRKVLNLITWDFWFSLINNNILIFRLPALCCKLLNNLIPPLISLEQFSQGHLRCCLLGTKS